MDPLSDLLFNIEFEGWSYEIQVLGDQIVFEHEDSPNIHHVDYNFEAIAAWWEDISLGLIY